MVRKLFEISDEFKNAESSHVVVFGTGRMALLACISLLQEGIEVTSFCDASRTKLDIKIMGRPVVGPEELSAHEDSLIVYAGENLALLEKDEEIYGFKNVWVDVRMYSIVNDCVWTFM